MNIVRDWLGCFIFTLVLSHFCYASPQNLPQNETTSVLPTVRLHDLFAEGTIGSNDNVINPTKNPQTHHYQQLYSRQDAEKLAEYLVQEKLDLINANKTDSLLIASLNQQNLSQHIQQNLAQLALIHAKIVSFEGFLANQRKHQKILANKIQKLNLALSQKIHPPSFNQASLTELMGMKEVNRQSILLINENLVLAHRLETLLLNNKIQLEEWNMRKQSLHVLDSLQHKIEKLYQARSELYQKNVTRQRNCSYTTSSRAQRGISSASFQKIPRCARDDVGDDTRNDGQVVTRRHEKQKSAHFSQQYHNELQLQLNNQNIALINDQIAELELQIKLVKTEDLFLQAQDIKAISASIEMYKDAIDQINETKQSLIKRIELFKEMDVPLLDNELKQQIKNLIHKAKQFINQEIEQEKKLNAQLDKKQQELKQQLSVRQTLVGYHVNNWMTIKTECSNLMIKLSATGYALINKITEGYSRQDTWRKGLFWLLMGAIALLTLVLKRLLKSLTQDKIRSRLSAHLYDGMILLLARNLSQLSFLLAMFTALMMFQISLTTVSLYIDLAMVWLIFRNLILISKMILLERERDVSGQDVRFFYRLKWLLLAGGWTTAWMVLSQKIPLSMLVQDVMTRIFMLFIFALSIVMWASKDVFPLLLRPALKYKKRYFRNAVSLLFILLPITLFTTAMIGLVGYMNLAWSMSRYQAYLVLVLTGYVLTRGLLSDAFELISEWMVSSLRNGWLWVEVFLRPFDKITHLGLFMISVIFLFELFGVYTEMPVIAWLKRFVQYEIIGVSGIHITVYSVIEFFIVVSVFVWAAKWTREFGYRWLFRHARDEGVRNSLSVFTQYAVILLGSYITLRVLGLDFSGMSMVIGGLAVGMGFGLRDFASNIVGGIMLLIERPVREGDLITIGEHEGRVAHIGIRSMRVSSGDNTEVLIPNAETFNKPFINWTHQDDVVRTVIPIKVSREDDPMLIQTLIYEVLEIIPEILAEPAAQVLLKQIDEALISFEVRYFINVRLHTRFEIRSKFLFALMAQFKAAGIKAPIPPMSVELKNGSSVFA